MANFYELTQEKILSAQTYMPINDKKVLARQIAELCLVGEPTAEQNKEGEKLLAMPMIKKEDAALKSILLMNAFLGYYLDIEVSADEDAYTQYDYYAGGNLFNQLERFKGNAECKNIVFDIISDFKELKTMVEVELRAIKEANNDPIARLTSAIQILSTPENIKKLSAEMQNSLKEEDIRTRKG